MHASHKEGLLSGGQYHNMFRNPELMRLRSARQEVVGRDERAGEGRVDVNDGHTEYSHRAGAPSV